MTYQEYQKSRNHPVDDEIEIQDKLGNGLFNTLVRMGAIEINFSSTKRHVICSFRLADKIFEVLLKERNQ